MIIQTFRAPTFQDACAQIKAALGPTAFIIKHDCVREKSIWGWLLGRSEYEVVAAKLDSGAPARQTGVRASRLGAVQRGPGRPVVPDAGPTAARRARMVGSRATITEEFVPKDSRQGKRSTEIQGVRGYFVSGPGVEAKSRRRENLTAGSKHHDAGAGPVGGGKADDLLSATGAFATDSSSGAGADTATDTVESRTEQGGASPADLGNVRAGDVVSTKSDQGLSCVLSGIEQAGPAQGVAIGDSSSTSKNAGGKIEELGSLKEQMARVQAMLEKLVVEQSTRDARLEAIERKVSVGDVSDEANRDRPSAAPAPVRELLARLRRAEFQSQVIARLRGHLFEAMDKVSLDDEDTVRRLAVDFLAERIKVTGGLDLKRGAQGKVVALVGPTGVGKTTTLAKLAAGLKFNFDLNVGFITIDTYRLAACEQLKQYGNIVDVPVHIAFEPKDVRLGLEKFADKDVILIDTVGRNAKRRSEIEDIRRFLDCDRRVETHLLLGANAKYSDLEKDMKNFSILGYEQVIITKVDEAATHGTMLSLLVSTGSPVSYYTIGQNVPDDIAVADGKKLVEMAIN